MNINSILLLNAISQHIMFATGSMIKNRKIENIEDVIKQVHKIYLHFGFKIMQISSDRDFEPLRKYMADLGILLKCKYKKERVPDIEKFNRTVKERVQYTQSAMPFKLIYKLMIVHIVASAIFLFKFFSSLKYCLRTVQNKMP